LQSLVEKKNFIFLTGGQYLSGQWPNYEICKYYEVFWDLFNLLQKEKVPFKDSLPGGI
jgi:hypothetical protein